MRHTVQFITGLILAVIAAAIMVEGSVLGESTTGIAIVMGVLGLLLIGTSNFRLLK